MPNLVDGLNLTAEMEAGISDGVTPLWLNANRYGLSSLESKHGYLRTSAIRPISVDSLKDWRLGYGVDIAAAAGFTSTLIVQQAYAEVAWKKLRLTMGSKEQPVDLTESELTSGSLVLGSNARPIPQVRFDIDYFPIPGTHGNWQWKMHGSYGRTTDANWQKDFAAEGTRYTSNFLYHEKALFWKFGKESNRRFPLTYEISLQMATQFGGTSYNATGRGHIEPSTIHHSQNLEAFLRALIPSGSDETDGTEKNTMGNHLGAYKMRLTYHGDDWKVSARFERFFEDQSMLTVQYGIYDHLLGMDIKFPANPWLSTFTLEHLSTRDQSGAVYHDQSANIPDKMNGRDNYYNHNLYTGYQHWGQSMGTPLLTSPIYNNGIIGFNNNRITAWHMGLCGNPTPWLHWRALATHTDNWGTYQHPYDGKQGQQYYMLETLITPAKWHGTMLAVALGMDHGKVVGNNIGGQLTIRKTIKL